MKILIITHSNDNDSVDLVTESLSSQGATTLRLDSDYYPNGLRFSSWQDRSGRRVFIGTGEGQMEISDLHAVWYRIKGRVAEYLVICGVKEGATLFGLGSMDIAGFHDPDALPLAAAGIDVAGILDRHFDIDGLQGADMFMA